MNCGRDRYEDMIDHVFISPQFKYDLSYSFTFFTFFGYIMISNYDQFPDGLIAQLVEH